MGWERTVVKQKEQTGRLLLASNVRKTNGFVTLCTENLGTASVLWPALRPDLIPEGLLGLGAGAGGWPSLPTHSRHSTHAETPAAGRRSIHPDTSPRRGSVLWPRTRACSLVDEPFGLISFCLCRISYKSFPHPTDPPKSQVLHAQESIYQSSRMRRMVL